MKQIRVEDVTRNKKNTADIILPAKDRFYWYFTRYTNQPFIYESLTPTCASILN